MHCSVAREVSNVSGISPGLARFIYFLGRDRVIQVNNVCIIMHIIILDFGNYEKMWLDWRDLFFLLF